MQSLSVIIPAFNEEIHIARTVHFLQLHGGADVLEIIVADGGSTDQTIEAARAGGATVLVCPQRGRNVQMNFAAARSRGDILYFVHADTLPPTQYVGAIREAVSGGIRLGNFRYRFDSDHPLLRINGWFTRWHFMFCQGGDKTLFIDRALFESLGGYAPHCTVMEEYDLLRRAKAAGHAFRVLPLEGLVSARKYEQNSWLRIQLANFLVFNLWAWQLAAPATLKKLYKRMLHLWLFVLLKTEASGLFFHGSLLYL